MVKSHDLADELGPLGDETLMNVFIDLVEPVLEGVVDSADPVQLSIVRSHHCTVVADQLFATVTEVSQLRLVKHASTLAVNTPDR